ncbi:hypothetical protein UK12_34790, partial [Saccharothrix sp. ST-888]
KTFAQPTLVGQLAASIVGRDQRILFYLVRAGTARLLLLAAHTAFNVVPRLTSLVAQHLYLPVQMHTRVDRLAFSNVIIALAVVAVVLLVLYKADGTSLIHLYILG